MLKKLELYMLFGVKEYWMVDLKNNLVNVYTLSKNEIIDCLAFHRGAHENAESVCFSGLKVALPDMFLKP